MTERANIIVPTNGVRKDVADLIQTPDMMRSGINVMVYDGTVRPRPGCTRQDIGGVVTRWTLISEGHNAFAAFNAVLLKQNADLTWEYSIDHGFEWIDVTSNVTGVTTAVELLFYLRDHGVLMAFLANGELWAAPVGSFPAPTDVDFVELGDYRAIYGPKTSVQTKDPVFYDTTSDTLYWQAGALGGPNARICALTNASTVTSGTFAANYFCGPARQTIPLRLCGCQHLSAGTGYCWTASDNGGGDWVYNAFTPATMDAGAFKYFISPHYYYILYTRDVGPLAMAYSLRGRSYSTFAYPQNMRVVPIYNHYTSASEDHQFRALMWADANSQCVVGADNIRTEDSWVTQSQYEDYPATVNWIIRLQAYDDGSSYYFLESLAAGGVNQAWFVNGQTGTGVSGDPLVGDALSLFQGDLDTEPSGLFLGTTKKMLHFDLANDVWSDLSPIDALYEIDGSDANHWVFRVMEKSGDKYILATNGQIPPIAWKETLEQFRPIGDLNEDGEMDIGETSAPVATCMAIANNRLVLGYGSGVWLSDPQDFDNGYSVEHRLTDTAGDIVAMRELNAITIAILKTDAIYHGISQAEFMGVSAPMRFELVKAGIVGPCSDASVVYMPDGRLCWLGRDGGVYIYDGAVPVDAGRHIRHAISPILDPNSFSNAHGAVDTKRNLLWFFIPTRAPSGYGMNLGLVMSIDQGASWPSWFVQWPIEWEIMSSTNVFTQTDMVYGDFGDLTYADMSEVPYSAFEGGVWNFMIARRNLATYTLDWSMANDNGIPVYVLMETGWYDFDDPYQFTTLHELHHLAEIGTGDVLKWTVFAEQADGSELSSESNLASNSYRRKTSYRLTGRRHRFRLESDVTNVFRWGGAAALVSQRGGR